MAGRLSSSSYLNNASSGKAEAVFKVSSQAMGKDAVRQVVQYIARDADYMEDEEPIALEDQDGNLITDKSQREALLAEWAEDFTAPAAYKKQEWKKDLLKKLDYERFQLDYKQQKHGLSKDEARRLDELTEACAKQKYTHNGKVYSLKINASADTKHIILSVGGKNNDPRKVNDAVREYLHDAFGAQGYKYVFAVHNDTENQHAHVIINTRNQVTGNCIFFDKEDLFIQRQVFAEKLTDYGIERISTLKRDRTKSLIQLQQKAAGLFERKTWFDQKVEQAKAVDAVGFRQNSLKTASFLLQEVQQQQDGTLLNLARHKELDELKKQLKAHKKALMDIPPERRAQEHKLTVENLAKEHAAILKKGEELQVSPAASPYQKKALKRKQTFHQEFMKRHQEQIALALKEFQRNAARLPKAAQADNKKAIQQLKELQKTQKRGLKI
jgi:hypothetical protein